MFPASVRSVDWPNEKGAIRAVAKGLIDRLSGLVPVLVAFPPDEFPLVERLWAPTIALDDLDRTNFGGAKVIRIDPTIGKCATCVLRLRIVRVGNYLYAKKKQFAWF